MMRTVQQSIAVATALSVRAPPPVMLAAQGAAKPAAPAQGAKPAPTTPAAAKPAAAKPAAAPAAASAAADLDGGWPRAYNGPSGAVFLLYTPQIASWDNQKRMVAYLAVSYTAKGAPKPALGTIKVEADTSVSVAERLVNFSNFRIVESNFQTIEKDKVPAVVQDISTAIPNDQRVIALDRILASVDKSQIVPKNVDGVKADPPVVFYSTSSAALV